VEVRSYPISVDVGPIQEQARSLEFAAYRSKLMSDCCEFTIVKVERVDPTKNTVLSMEAFRQMLISHPDLLGRVTMLAFLVPSRTNIPEYRRFKQRLMGLVDSINGQFGRPGYLPIRVFYEDNYLQALAGMSLYDVLLVNPVADGMNLVAKEGPLVNRNDGVLVLSETAGAHDQLRSGALSVRHGDLKGTADALYRALFMPRVERQRRAAFLRSSIEREDLTHWLRRQFQDVFSLSRGRGRRGQDAALTF
ncbi:MAG: trehalose-6-phosphate synthase, partial [Dehalococcoidia bacterium]|nr:trehalose-6-phosphate synthase [Dehalococcoidia bacterium]